MPEGTVFFPNEPILRVTAPLPQAQLVETAADQYPAFPVADRRQGGAHGARGARQAAGRFRPAPRAWRRSRPDGGARELHRRLCRHRHRAGRAAHSASRSSARWRIRSSRRTTTRATAFEHFARSRPENLVPADRHLRYRERPRERSSRSRPASGRTGITIRGCGSTSGDLVALVEERAPHPRRRRTAPTCTIFASGGLDEDELAAMLRAGAPIDGFGVGTSLTTSSDVPALDCAYKLQEYAGVPRRKRSAGKATWPGRKQVWRRYGCGRPHGRRRARARRRRATRASRCSGSSCSTAGGSIRRRRSPTSAAGRRASSPACPSRCDRSPAARPIRCRCRTSLAKAGGRDRRAPGAPAAAAT